MAIDVLRVNSRKCRWSGRATRRRVISMDTTRERQWRPLYDSSRWENPGWIRSNMESNPMLSDSSGSDPEKGDSRSVRLWWEGSLETPQPHCHFPCIGIPFTVSRFGERILLFPGIGIAPHKVHGPIQPYQETIQMHLQFQAISLPKHLSYPSVANHLVPYSLHSLFPILLYELLEDHSCSTPW